MPVRELTPEESKRLQSGSVRELPPGTRLDRVGLDRTSGAPWNVRAVVGLERDPKRKLSALRKFYPDAEPFGDDNFVYTDKKGQRRLYNDEGWFPSVGDIASVGPEISEFIGGAGGAAAALAPAAAAAPPTAGASLLTLPLAYGLGAAGGREAYEQGTRALLGAPDPRSLPEHLTDTAVTVGANILGQRGGEVLQAGLKRAIDPVRSYIGQKFLSGVGTSRGALRDFEAAGVTPSAGAVTGNRAIQMFESGLLNTPGGAAALQRRAEKQLVELRNSVDDLAQQFGVGKASTSGQKLGEGIAAASGRAGERFAQRRAAISDSLEREIGGDTPVSVSNVTAQIDALKAEIAKAPQTLGPILGPALRELERVATDAATSGGRLPFAILRQARTALGAQLERPDVAGYTPASEAALRRAYGILSEDIKAAANASGPKAAQLLKLHDRYVRFHRNVNIPMLDDIAKKDYPGQVLQYAMSGVREDGTRLARLRRNFTKEEWEAVAGSVLMRLGRARPGQQGATGALTGEGEDFSIAAFLTEYNKLAPEARRALWGGTQFRDLVPELNRLVRVVDRLKDAEKVANPSGTARNLSTQLWFTSALGAIPTAAVTGNIGASLAAGAVSATGLVVLPYNAAKLISNPKFVRWLAGAAGDGTRSNLGGRLGRLYAIAEGEPELREAINQYVQVLQATVPE